MTDTKIDVDHLAKLAKLQISDKEKQTLARQLVQTIDYVEMLQELDTQDTPTTAQVTGLRNIANKDQPEKSLSQDEALANAPKKTDGYFAIKKIQWNS